MKTPFNVRLPEGALKVMEGDKHIGYVWKGQAALRVVDASVMHLAEQKPRWGSMTLDGVEISHNSRTYREAIRTLKAGIARKVKGDPHTSRTRKSRY